MNSVGGNLCFKLSRIRQFLFFHGSIGRTTPDIHYSFGRSSFQYEDHHFYNFAKHLTHVTPPVTTLLEDLLNSEKATILPFHEAFNTSYTYSQFFVMSK